MKKSKKKKAIVPESVSQHIEYEFKKSDEFVNRGSVSEKGVVDVEAEFVADFSDNFPFEFGPVRG